MRGLLTFGTRQDSVWRTVKTKEHVAAWLLEISGQPIVGLEHEAAITQTRYQLAASKAWRELMGLRTLREDAEGY